MAAQDGRAAQAPASQALPAAQALPQRPQWAAAVRVSVSQPLPTIMSQSARPTLHTLPQTEPTQVAAAPGGAAQARPQPPQCGALVRVSTSQPSASSPLQSAKPATQSRAQRPAAQAGRALGLEGHATPHMPQCEALARVSASQPLVTLRSQSPKPMSQRAVHAPSTQAPVAFGGMHARPQPPQWAALARVSASQPLAAMASQSAKPAAHA
jgi:hypothetical protein